MFHRWDAADEIDQRNLHLVGWAFIVYLAHYALFSFWYIEDAAITFAFARHAVQGEGFVAWPGGERVEGFSNPTWTLLLMAADRVGINPFVSAKLFGAIFGLATLGLAWAWARAIFGHRRDLFPGITALALAFSPQFVLWNAAGLENAIFGLALSAGAVLGIAELRARRAPWSAIAWATLALTRPEGALYGAIAGVHGALWIARLQGIRQAARWGLGWGALVFVPTLAYLSFRHHYFGWIQPNTYYAKLDGETRFDPWAWNKRGWNYAREYALFSGQGFLLPLYYVGQSGLFAGLKRPWLAGVLVAAVGIAAAALLAPGLLWVRELGWVKIPGEPAALQSARIGLLFGIFLLLPWVGLYRARAPERMLTWYLALGALFFVLYSGGDWMQEHRLLAMGVVPMSVLLADALSLLWRHAPSRGLRALALAPLAVPLVMGPVRTGVFLSNPETTPFDVSRQVFYKDLQAKRLHMDNPTLMQVDMGAHMWWSDHEQRDLPGLIDVPFGHHEWDRPFVREYVFEEYKPTFSQIHGGWGKRTGLLGMPELRNQYIEVPPYPISPWRAFTGNWVRRDTFIEPYPSPAPAPRARFEGGLELVSWAAPAPDVFPGGSLYLEVSIARPVGPQAHFRLFAFLARGESLVVRELPPGYDWYMPKQWKRAEMMHQRHTLSLPDNLEEGSWDLGFAAVLTDGAVLPAVEAEPGALPEVPRLMTGEVRWTHAVTVRPESETLSIAETKLEKALSLASSGRCEGAEETWAQARRHSPPEHPWQASALSRLSPAMALCYAGRLAQEDRAAAVEAVRRGRAWDHRQPDLARKAALLADRLVADGEEYLTAGRVEEAYDSWRDALWADPTRARLRRKTEELRDWRLSIGPKPSWTEGVTWSPPPSPTQGKKSVKDRTP